MTEKTDRPVLPVALTEDQYKKIDKEAQTLGSSKASVVRAALVEYLEEGRD